MLAGGYNSDGGGCITADAGANVTLNNVTLAGNISSYGGGAVYLGGSNSNPSHLQVNNSKLEYNKSISSHGTRHLESSSIYSSLQHSLYSGCKAG